MCERVIIIYRYAELTDFITFKVSNSHEFVGLGFYRFAQDLFYERLIYVHEQEICINL